MNLVENMVNIIFPRDMISSIVEISSDIDDFPSQ